MRAEQVSEGAIAAVGWELCLALGVGTCTAQVFSSTEKDLCDFDNKIHYIFHRQQQ